MLLNDYTSPVPMRWMWRSMALYRRIRPGALPGSASRSAGTDS